MPPVAMDDLIMTLRPPFHSYGERYWSQDMQESTHENTEALRQDYLEQLLARDPEMKTAAVGRCSSSRASRSVHANAPAAVGSHTCST